MSFPHVLCPALFGLSLFRILGRSSGRGVLAAEATIVLVLLTAIHVILARFSQYFISPTQELAYAVGVNLQSQDRLIFTALQNPSLIFYAKRAAILIRPVRRGMLPHLVHPGRTMILLPSSLKSQLPQEGASFSYDTRTPWL